MQTNQTGELRVDIPLVRSKIPPLEQMATDLDHQNGSFIRALEEADGGDQRGYLSQALNHGYDAAAMMRSTYAELGEIIGQVYSTVNSFEDHDNSVRAEAPALAPTVLTTRTALPNMASLAATTRRNADVAQDRDDDRLHEQTSAHMDVIDTQKGYVMNAIPSAEGIAKVMESSLNAARTAPTILASQPTIPITSATITSSNSQPLQELEKEEEKHWWSWFIEPFKAFISVLVDIFIGIVIFTLVLAIIIAFAILLVKAGIIAAASLAVCITITATILAVAYGLMEFFRLRQEYQLHFGYDPNGIDNAKLIAISIFSLIGIPQVVESIRGKRLITNEDISSINRWELGMGGSFQAILTIAGVRTGVRKGYFKMLSKGDFKMLFKEKPFAKAKFLRVVMLSLKSLEKVPDSTSGMVFRPKGGKTKLPEVLFSDKIARQEGKKIILTGEEATPGIDGVFAESKDVIQLKTVNKADSASVPARNRIKEAYDKAKKANYKNVKLYIEAEMFSKSDILYRWNNPDKSTFLPHISDGTISNIKVYCSDGVIELPVNE